MNELYIKGRPLNQQQFINLINVKIIIGKNFINPSRKGTTIIKNNDGSKITYQRKKSNIFSYFCAVYMLSGISIINLLSGAFVRFQLY